MRRFIRKTVRRVIFVLLLIVAFLWWRGYQEYKYTLQQTPLELKIEHIQNKPTYLNFEAIPELFLDGTVSVEDERFYTRILNIDIEAILRATWVNLKNFDLLEGGSTIPQQVSKNLYFDHSASLTRKVAEYYVTKDLLDLLGKDEILELYVNIAYYGHGSYGVNEASFNYFKRPLSALNDKELTILIGLPQAPSVYDLTQNFDLALKRQTHVLSRMVSNGIITEERATLIKEMEVNGYEKND